MKEKSQKQKLKKNWKKKLLFGTLVILLVCISFITAKIDNQKEFCGTNESVYGIDFRDNQLFCTAFNISGGGGSENPFDQSLNKSDTVRFKSVGINTTPIYPFDAYSTSSIPWRLRTNSNTGSIMYFVDNIGGCYIGSNGGSAYIRPLDGNDVELWDYDAKRVRIDDDGSVYFIMGDKNGKVRINSTEIDTHTSGVGLLDIYYKGTHTNDFGLQVRNTLGTYIASFGQVGGAGFQISPTTLAVASGDLQFNVVTSWKDALFLITGLTKFKIGDAGESYAVQIPDKNQRLVFNNSAYITYDGTNLKVITNMTGIGNSTRGGLWVSGWISSEDYTTRTSVYDKSKGSALDFIKDSGDMLTSKGKINHSIFYGYVKHEITDYSKPVYKPINITDCKNVLIGNGRDKIICENKTIIETTYPFKTIEEAISLGNETAMIEQSIYELKLQNQELTKRIEILEGLHEIK